MSELRPGWTCRSPVSGGLALALFFGGVGPVTAQTGGVVGRVVEVGSERPLDGALVSATGTALGVLTSPDGGYLLPAVPAGSREIRVVMLGYATEARTVTVEAGRTLTVDFALDPSAVDLDAIVVTATGEQRKRQLGNTVAGIAASTVVGEAPIRNLSDLLQARAPGVQVLQSTGTVGMGARIRIRGSNSISLSNEPLIYVDGIRVESGAESLSIPVGGQAPSRLNDLNPEDIESIEIVKGPSAATLYGTEAANGVIRITTKRGRPGTSRWNAWVEAGRSTDPTEYPLNYAGLDPDGVPGTQQFCILELQRRGLCEQESLASFQVLNDDELSPIGTGSRRQYGLSVSGGTDLFTYYLSAELEDEVGTYDLPGADLPLLEGAGLTLEDHVERPNRLEKVNVRANLGAALSDETRVRVSTGYVSANHDFTFNDNAGEGVLPSGYFGRPFREQNDGWGFLRPYQSFGVLNRQEIERFTTSATVDWTPLAWLQGRVTGGIDFTDRGDVQFFPRELDINAETLDGFRASNFRRIYQYTLDAGATASKDLTDRVASRTSVGVQFFRDLFTGTDANGRDIAAGSTSIGGAAITEANEVTVESKTLGLFVEQQLALDDRLFVTGALRGDDNSAFGRDFDVVVYPKLSVSWLLSEEPWLPRPDALGSLRVRAAWGESGLQPGSTDAVRALDPVAVTSPFGSDIIGVTYDNIGNPDLEAERSRELEVGVDADLFAGRLGMELTWYRKTTRDALVRREIAPSAGASTGRWENLGSVRNQGWEAMLDTRLLSTPNVQWDVFLSGSTNDNELLELGEGVEPIGGLIRHVEGHPLGGWWSRPILGYEDANGDGIIGPDEVEVGEEAIFKGTTLPRHEVALSSAVTLFDRVRASALFDYRGGFHNYNLTEEFRCDTFAICGALNDPATSFEDQARAVASTFHPANTEWGYIQDASFVKLREVALTFLAPDRWAGALGARNASLTLTGRNLATWTDYTGIDPEMNQEAQDNFATVEFLTQPPLRYWTARVNLGF